MLVENLAIDKKHKLKKGGVMARYKVTGKFCLLTVKGKLLKKEVYLNKIKEAGSPLAAKDQAMKELVDKFSKKFQTEVELLQISNILVKRA